MKLSALALALALTFGASAAFAQAVAGPADVEKRLATAGYTEVRDLEFDDGLWEAEVRGADGRWHDVAVHADSGEVLDDRGPRALLPAAEVIKRIEAAGYTQVHDLDLDDAVWEADALDAKGERVELRLNGHTGAVLSVETERYDD